LLVVSAHLGLFFYKGLRFFFSRGRATFARPLSRFPPVLSFFFTTRPRKNAGKMSSTRTAVKEAVAAVGGVLTTTSFIPQIIAVYKNGPREVSISFLYVYLAGSFMWLTYGIMVNAWKTESSQNFDGISVIVFSAITIVLVSTVIGLVRRGHL
jgi:uncharacterized protein with PQ loop repeat